MARETSRRFWTLTACALLGACGGGGSGSSPGLSSSIAPASGSVQIVEGATGQFDFTVTVSGAPGATSVPVVTVDAGVVQQGPVDASVPGRFTVHLQTAPGIEAGTHAGVAGFRLCADAACSTVYAGTQQTFAYTATVQLLDWATFQRDAAHTGFVNTTLDPGHFARIWSWSRPAGDPEPIGGINAVATGAGKVFVTKDVYFGNGAVYALDETDGSLTWTYAHGPLASAGPAAFGANTVYAPTTDQAENCVIWGIDALTGLYKFKMPSACQWSNFFEPTVQGASVMQASQAGSLYSFSTVDGAQQWSTSAGSYDQSTPAADGRYAYQYGTSGAAPSLHVLDRSTGAPVSSIGDPFSTGFSGYSMFSAVMLGSTGNAIAFSGGGFSGRAASSSEQFDPRVLVSYDVVHASVGWRSANAYMTHPAIANGVVYAARNAPASLDALSETDGHLLWSWTPPAGNSSFHRNVVVTRNLVFVSTDANVYAVDLATHQAVWQYPQAGMLAISANSVLYIATGATISDGNLVAIRLK